MGLLLYVLGALCFYPSATNRVYGGFVGSLFTIASGLAMLENCKSFLLSNHGSIIFIFSISQVLIATSPLSDQEDGHHFVLPFLKLLTVLALPFHLWLHLMHSLVVMKTPLEILTRSNGHMLVLDVVSHLDIAYKV